MNRAGRIDGLLPAEPTARRRVLNAQGRVRDLEAKRQATGFLSTLDLTIRANAQAILDRHNATAS